jgi:hypothetical protein
MAFYWNYSSLFWIQNQYWEKLSNILQIEVFLKITAECIENIALYLDQYAYSY